MYDISEYQKNETSNGFLIHEEANRSNRLSICAALDQMCGHLSSSFINTWCTVFTTQHRVHSKDHLRNFPLIILRNEFDSKYIQIPFRL